MKRWLIFFLLFCSCQGILKRPADSLVTSLDGEPTILNPLLATDSNSASICKHIYERMLDLDIKTMRYKPLLAETWEVSPDHLDYTFHLRRNVHWHDGQLLSADDVVFTFQTILNPNIHAESLRSYLSDVTEVKKLDDFTVQIHYKEPYFRALEIVGFMPILPKHIFERGDFHQNPANEMPMGTGPYRLAKHQAHQSVVLERFDGYWGEKPHFQRLTLPVISDQATRFFQLRKGALDFEGLTSLQWRRKAQESSFQRKWSTFRYYMPNFSAVAWNMRDAKFADVRVRTALALAFNYNEFLQSTMLGEGEQVIGNFYKQSDYYARDIQALPFAPQKALQLLHEAGWQDSNQDGWLDRDGKNFEFNFFYPQGSAFWRSFGLVYQSQLKKIGINLQLRELEWTALLDFITKREFDAVGIAWRLPPEQDPYQLWHSSQVAAGSNLTGFQNEEVDNILITGRREFDRTKRIQIYHRLQEILYQEQPYLFLYSTPSFIAVSKRLSNVVLYPLGLNPNEWTAATFESLPVW